MGAEVALLVEALYGLLSKLLLAVRSCFHRRVF
jgi:hypothetical protein